MKKPIVFILLLTVTILFLSIIQVAVSNRMSTAGVALVTLQDQIKTYQTENALISEKLLTTASYKHISTTAQDKGYISAKTEVFLTTPLPIAVKQ